MTTFKWEVKKSTIGAINKVQLETNPIQEPLNYFFSGIKPEEYPRLLHQVNNKTGYENNITGMTFSGDLDPCDPPFPEGKLEIYHQVFGEQFIDEKCFFHILDAFANQLLITYQNSDNNFPEKWHNDMKDGIKNLKIINE